MSTKTLLLGLRRADDLPHGEALDPVPSGSGRRLHQISGLPLEEYNATFDRANAADLPNLANRRVVVLGHGAWKRVGLPPAPWFTTTTLPCGATLTLVPHPSGRCRLYNDPDVRERVRGLLQNL